MGTFPGSKLKRQDFAEFLVRAYMGDGRRLGRGLRWSPYLSRAYLDFNRTLHGFASCTDADARLQESAAYLEARIGQLLDDPPVASEPFDSWHATTCSGLERKMGLWGDDGSMDRGQSQKWVNMSLKYLFTGHVLGLVPEFSAAKPVYRSAHLPLDRYVLTGLSEKGCPHARAWIAGWSRMDAKTYESIQAWCREYVGSYGAVLDLDWDLWSNR